jgi:hypothetical protein
LENGEEVIMNSIESPVETEMKIIGAEMAPAINSSASSFFVTTCTNDEADKK